MRFERPELEKARLQAELKKHRWQLLFFTKWVPLRDQRAAKSNGAFLRHFFAVFPSFFIISKKMVSSLALLTNFLSGFHPGSRNDAPLVLLIPLQREFFG